MRSFRTGAGSPVPERSAFDVSRDDSRGGALPRAAFLARASGQLVAWDISERAYAIGLYEARTDQVRPLTDEEAAILLNRDSVIRRAWRKWNAMSGNQGSLILLDQERALRILEPPAQEHDDDGIDGLA